MNDMQRHRDRALRILLVSFIENSDRTGMGKWSHEMSRALSTLGHKPTLWFAGDFPRVERMGRMAVLVFPVALAYRLARERGLWDAIVIHEPSGFWYASLRRLMPSLPPMVAMCHNVERKVYGELRDAADRGQAAVPGFNRIKAPLFRLWQSTAAVRLADHVVCLSSTDRDYIVSKLGRSPHRVTVQPNGVIPARSAGSRQVRGHRVLFVGTWEYVKGRGVLPRLWSRVHATLPDATLTIAGSGASAASVEAEFDAVDRSSVVVLPGRLDETAMQAQYAAHDVFVMPSISEGSPLSLLEAMAADLPVVATRVGGIPDIVSHGDHGLLFDVSAPDTGADYVRQLLTDSCLATTIGAAGRARVESFTWKAAAERLADAIGRVVAGSGFGAS